MITCIRLTNTLQAARDANSVLLPSRVFWHAFGMSRNIPANGKRLYYWSRAITKAEIQTESLQW